jgi:hypothetical protein
MTRPQATRANLKRDSRLVISVKQTPACREALWKAVAPRVAFRHNECHAGDRA